MLCNKFWTRKKRRKGLAHRLNDQECVINEKIGLESIHEQGKTRSEKTKGHTAVASREP